MNEKKIEEMVRQQEARAERYLREAEQRAAAGSGCRGVVGNVLLLVLLNLAVVAMAAGTLWFGWRGYTLTTQGGTANAQVIELAESSDGEGGCCVYSPVFEYTVNGQRYQFESLNASSPPAYRVGQQVEIRYNLKDPSDAAVNSFGELWLVASLLCPATIVLAIVVNVIGFVRIRNGQAILDED